MFEFYNPNPCKILVGDCVVRAISLAENKTWRETFIDLCTQGYMMCDMPSSNAVWHEYLLQHGYDKQILGNVTISQFADEHPQGTYILGTGEHAVCVKDGGKYLDTWNSGNELVLVCFKKTERSNNAVQ